MMMEYRGSWQWLLEHLQQGSVCKAARDAQPIQHKQQRCAAPHVEQSVGHSKCLILNCNACTLPCLLLKQALVDAQATERLVANLRKRINGSVADMRAVFESFDTASSGVVPSKTFQAACAALGVVLSPMEKAWVKSAAADASGHVRWCVFCDAFTDA